MSLPSGLLSPSENQKVNDILDPDSSRRSQRLSTAVARVYLTTQQSQHREWVLLITGVVCLIKDFDRRSYYITVLCMDTAKKFWEQEVYNEMRYKESMDNFHTFEADKCMVGINFADEGECKHFSGIINERLSKMKNREVRKSVRPLRSQIPESRVQTEPPHPTSNRQQVAPMVPKDRKKAKKKAKKDEKPKISKADIGKPTNFIHAQGIKSSAAGFEQVDNTLDFDEALREFLSHSGIPSNVMKDPQKAEEVKQFVKDNHVVQQITDRRRTMKPEATVNALEAMPHPPPPPVVTSGGSSVVVGALPPPPPPPPPSTAALASPPSVSSSRPPLPEVPKPKNSTPVDFLEQIRMRGQMKKGGLMSVNDPENKRKMSSEKPIKEDNSLAGLLKAGLENIHNAAQGSDSEDDSHSESEDSWEGED